MGGQLVAMGMGMGRMFFGQDRFFDRLVLRVGLRAGNRMVPGIFQLAIPVLAGSGLDRGFQGGLVFCRGLSWRHNE